MNSSDQQKALLEELACLCRKQSDAFQTAIYIPMSKQESIEYEERAKRINELCELVKDFKTE
jgi:hypothetical protein